MIRRALQWVVCLVVAGQAGLVAAPIETLGSVEHRPVADLDAAWQEALAQPGMHWVGWTVDASSGRRAGFECRVVLGKGHQSWGRAGHSPEPFETLLLVEVTDGRVSEVQVTESNCLIDARGTELVLWSGISTADSYRWVDRTLVTSGDADHREDGLAALAAHRVERATDRLEDLAEVDPVEDVRHAAIFWLGEARGAEGYAALRRLESRLAVDDIAETLVFAYSISEAPEAPQRLLDLARDHRASEVREQALFWVAQAAGERATETLERAVAEDPESEVREAAVFGLSQLPAEQGIPALIRVARTHQDPEVVEQAFFWLGESGDPRALELFAEILRR